MSFQKQKLNLIEGCGGSASRGFQSIEEVPGERRQRWHALVQYFTRDEKMNNRENRARIEES